MKIIHLSYSVPRPKYTDPDSWLTRISFITGVYECETSFAEVEAIFHISFSGKSKRNGVTYSFTNLKRWQLFFPLLFHRQVRVKNPDVIVVHGLIFPLQVLLLRLQLGPRIKIILQHHAEPPFSDFRKYLQRWADRYIKAYLFASTEQGLQWVQRGQIKALEKIKVVMGTSSPFFPMDRAVASQFTGVHGAANFLWVGGLDNNKDPLLVVNAFAEFVKTSPSARLYMIYQSFGLLSKLKQTIEELQMTNSIYAVGFVENKNLQYWYNSVDFIISSSHYEGSGIAVCEAMSCGCIPLVTDIPSFRMMTDHGAIGLLYLPGDLQGLINVFKKSTGINIETERKKVLSKFEQDLSFNANARKILHVIQAVD